MHCVRNPVIWGPTMENNMEFTLWRKIYKFWSHLDLSLIESHFYVLGGFFLVLFFVNYR